MEIGLLTVETKTEDLAVITKLTGRLDVLTSRDLDRHIHEILQTSPKVLILDLSKLDYVSSAGLRVLLQARKTLKVTGGTVCLCAANEFVGGVLSTTGFTGIFPCFDTVSAALQANADALG